MSRSPANRKWERAGGWSQLLGIVLGLAFCAGCVTGPSAREAMTRRALQPVPKIDANLPRSDQALVASFFAASGIRLTSAQLDQIIPPAAPQGRIHRTAIRNAATKGNRLLLAVKADERFLWDELGHNQPLLVLLPPHLRYNPAAIPLIPVAWDRAEHVIELLDGHGDIQSLPEETFFGRRDPLKHAALCLVKPDALGHFEPTREQKLLLADFWFDKGFYRRAGAAYADVEDSSLAGADIEALVGRGNALFRQGRYEEAIPVFRAALALEPKNPKILNNLAYAMLHGEGELLAALRHAEKAAQLDPENPLILETIGSINLRLGDAAAATEHLEQAWARSSQYSPEVQIAIMDQLVRAWNASDRKDLAWQVAETRHRMFPQNKVPKDILFLFPALRNAPAPPESK
jgi:tetratricopeptide (TPR) repeat protein